ncbi:MAG: Fic family protein [Thermoleophilia bacterium]
MRTYEQTHPWLDFSFDLRGLSEHDWMLFGEARSKCEHIAGVPLLPAVALRLHRVYLIKGAAATTAIEGNTLSEDEVRARVEGTGDLSASREYLGVEVDNVVAAYNEIVDHLAAGGQGDLTPDRIKQFNARVLSGLELEDGVVPGEVRSHSVAVHGYRGAPAEDCDHLLSRLCDWLNSRDFRHDDPEWAFCLAVLRAVIAHLYLEWIHPFGDGNGRTGRLIEYQLLIASGFVSSPAAHLLSNHYNLTRNGYYRALDQARQPDGGEFAFARYALQGFVDGLRDQLRVIQEQQLAVMWRDYVSERLAAEFERAASPAAARARALMLAMDGPVERTQVTDLNAEVARLYARVSPKTLQRDLATLEELELVVRDGDMLTPNGAALLAFLPFRVPPGGGVNGQEPPGQA